MKHGTFNMILKAAEDRVFNGNSRHPHDPRKFARRHHKWRQCSWLSSIWKLLFTSSSFHKASQQGLLFVNIELLCEAVCRKRPDLWPNDWILHYENDPADKALSVKQFWPKKSITEMKLLPFPLIWLWITYGCFWK